MEKNWPQETTQKASYNNVYEFGWEISLSVSVELLNWPFLFLFVYYLYLLFCFCLGGDILGAITVCNSALT